LIAKIKQREELIMERTINRGDVFFANLGFSGSSRQGGVRPIVIISNQMCNRYSSIVSVVCLTTSKTKAHIPTHVSLSALETGLKKDSICLCEQPMTIAKSDLREFVTTLSTEKMKMVDAGLRCQLCL
jgi:mRNA interferase MazF